MMAQFMLSLSECYLDMHYSDGFLVCLVRYGQSQPSRACNDTVDCTAYMRPGVPKGYQKNQKVQEMDQNQLFYNWHWLIIKTYFGQESKLNEHWYHNLQLNNIAYGLHSEVWTGNSQLCGEIWRRKKPFRMHFAARHGRETSFYQFYRKIQRGNLALLVIEQDMEKNVTLQ